MLKHIPAILPPELVKILMEMGHGDRILLGDANYPKFGCPAQCVRMEGIGIPEILDAILYLMPLDQAVKHPTILMAINPGDPYIPHIWEKYREIGRKYDPKGLREKEIPNTEFYQEGPKCYACIATGERALYGNIILRKGVVKEE